MSKRQTVVDTASTADICAALKKINATKGLRIKTGVEALVMIYQANQHKISRAKLEERFGALDLHFGWLCRRTAEELGSNTPAPFALVDQSTSEEGEQLFTLKASVAAALAASGMKGSTRP